MIGGGAVVAGAECRLLWLLRLGWWRAETGRWLERAQVGSTSWREPSWAASRLVARLLMRMVRCRRLPTLMNVATTSPPPRVFAARVVLEIWPCIRVGCLSYEATRRELRNVEASRVVGRVGSEGGFGRRLLLLLFHLVFVSFAASFPQIPRHSNKDVVPLVQVGEVGETRRRGRPPRRVDGGRSRGG